MLLASPQQRMRGGLEDASGSKIAVIFHRVGPYHAARLRAAAAVLPTTAVEMSISDETYAWDPVLGSDLFGRVTLFQRQDSRRETWRRVRDQVHKALDELSPEVVLVPGWAQAEAISALIWCAQQRTPAIVMSESTAWDEPRAPYKEWAKRRIVRLCSAGLAGGVPHSDYLVSLGMPRARVFLGYDAVDNGYFETKADEARRRRTEDRGGRTEDRGRLELPERYFLASARFVEKKNLGRLLQAYARYRKLVVKAESAKRKAEAWGLVLLGDGPLKADLESQISDLNLSDYVLLPGFKQYDELPVYYGLASAFVHASTTEQWGLVVNEAMASGLPVLVSNRCGCAKDLVKEGVNGFTFDPFNVEDIANLMLRVSRGTNSNEATSGPDLKAMGQASREIISQWGPERFASGLRDAVELALKLPRPRATLLDKLLLRLLLARS